MMTNWLIASNNLYKTADLQLALAYYGLSAASYQTLMAPVAFPEEGVTSYQDNATAKVKYLAALVPDTGVIADDSGLTLAALGQSALGVTTKRTLHAQSNLSDNQAILAALAGQSDRRATMWCTLVAVTPHGRLTTATGTVSGYIAPAPVGDQSTGFDRIFTLALGGPTLAELSDKTRIPLTHRGRAAKQLVASLTQEGD
ncbi:non-canonical purine NTP pyrophosphatase [Secundilactobacillus kimchicus]|nr:non-canonical purine NTP pyrophosphatase [Secundilactobacillus kimchicus]